MEPKHALALGTTATLPVATCLKFWVALIMAHWTHAFPTFDDTTALAHAALLVWGVSVYALAKGINLPPMEQPTNPAAINNTDQHVVSTPNRWWRDPSSRKG